MPTDTATPTATPTPPALIPGTALTSANGPFTLTVRRSPAPNGLTITLTVTNDVNTPLIWTSGCQFGYLVRLQTLSGAVVRHWPPPPFCDIAVIRTLKPGQAVTQNIPTVPNLTDANGLPLPPGVYDVTASVDLDQYNASGPTTVTTDVHFTWTA